MSKRFDLKPQKSNILDTPPRSEGEKGRTKGILRRLMRYIFAHPVLFITAIVFTLLSNQLALLGPEYSGVAVDAIASEGGVDFDAVYENVIKMIFC